MIDFDNLKQFVIWLFSKFGLSEREKFKQPVAYVKSEKFIIGFDGKKVSAGVLEDRQYDFDIEPIIGPHETIGLGIERTINMGNYESIKMSVFRSMPVHPGSENIESAYVKCKEWVGGKLTDQVKKVVDYRDSRSKPISNSGDRNIVNKVTY